MKNQLSSSVLHQNIKIQIYKTIILFVYFVWVLNLVVHTEAELRLRVFENRELRRTFGPRRDEVREEWRKLHKVELNDIYSLPNIFWVIKCRRMRRA